AVVDSVDKSVPIVDDAPTSQPDLDVTADESPSAETLEEMVSEHADTPSEETIISTETIEESPLLSEDETAEQDTKPLLGEVSIVESGFASVFMG
ncbi:hypothetical protein, partial [Vibrio cholerae]|uniref:hypothetical protein n=2 Tax=Bacteria TaxID=2 RepID=UPI0039C94525